MVIFKNTSILAFLNEEKIQIRPNAGHGIWLMFLLPLAIIISVSAHPAISTATYKVSSIFSFGLVIASLVFIVKAYINRRLKLFNVFLLTTAFLITLLFRICLGRGYIFSLWSALVSTFFYQKFYLMVLKKLPNCFSLGEAAVCTQAYTMLLYFTAINVYTVMNKTSFSVLQMSTLTIQMGLVGLSTIIFLSYKFNIRDPAKFYVLTACVFIFMVLLFIQFLIKINPLILIINMFLEDLQRHRILLCWAFCSILAVIVVKRRINEAQKATTSVRKIFHLFLVAVFIPGLLYNCSLLYLATGVVLGVFFMLETLRVLNIPPLAEGLQNGLVIFGDEKDTGIVAFTPMYLLGGCSFPVWIHPAPCDVTNSAIFNLLPLLSGVLTIGVGDTAASIIGSKFGRHCWKNSRKTIEGTIAYIVSLSLVVFIFLYFDFIRLVSFIDYFKTALGIIITAAIEAKTDQIDNLVLPFVMYIILVI